MAHRNCWTSSNRRFKSTTNNYPHVVLADDDRPRYNIAMSETAKKKSRNSAAANLGRRGGKAFVKKYGKKRMRELANLGAKARWNK